MNTQETIKMFSAIVALCDKSEKFANADRAMVDAWTEMLADIPFDLAISAIKVHVATSPFAPKISDIRNAAIMLTRPQLSITAEDAWDKTLKAVRQYGINLKKHALSTLPKEVADFVEKSWYRDICLTMNVDVVRGQFMRAWDARSAKARTEALLPPSVRQFAGVLAQSTAAALGSGEGE